MKSFLVIYSLAAALVLLVACSPQVATQIPMQPATPAPAAELTAVEPKVASAATPTARRGLEATDPTTVSLGAGRPALVEFFAFW